MRFALLVLALALGLFGCTENQRARNFGGTMKVALPCDTKLVTATWKQDNLWYLTRAARENELPEDQTLYEDSNFGIVNGKVLFDESVCK
jgi:hypothetical protein